MASSIFFLGRQISRPGSYVTVDATGLEQVGLGSTGIVAILGEAEGGRPVSDIDDPSDIIRLTTAQANRRVFRSGELREAAAMAFEPSNDPDIAGGAAVVLAMKVNPATQSTGNLQASGVNVIDLTSVDYGAFTEQVSVNLSAASAGLTGYLLVVSDGVNVETVDGLGGDSVAVLEWNTSTNTYDTVTVDVLNSGAISASGTFTQTGLSAQLDAAFTAADTANITATAADAGKVMTLYGLVGSTLTTENVVLTAGTVSSSSVWADLYGASLNADAEGAITVNDDVGTVFTFGIGDRVRGGVLGEAFFVDDETFNVQVDSTASGNVHIFGTTSTGAPARESITLPGASGVDVASTITPRRISFIGLTEVPGTDTITLSATVAQTNPANQHTLALAAEFFNSRQQSVSGSPIGFVWTTTGPNPNQPVTQLDEVAGASAAGTGAELTADAFAIINWLNNNSQIVSAELTSGAARTGPDVTPIPVYLSGGVEGVTTFADWQKALDLLRQVDVSTIVPLTGDQAVHLAVRSHCEYMAGIGRNERDAIVGLVAINSETGAPTSSPPTLGDVGQLQRQLSALNTRHVRAVGQDIVRFNINGVRTQFPPYFGAVIAAGMQAGSPIGTSLTYKFANVLDFRQNPNWSPAGEGEQLIQSGLLFLENVQGSGIRWVRNVTTYTASNNLAFTEGSVNEAVNQAVRTLRERLEFAVGRRGFAGTVNAVRSLALNTLGLLVDEGIITDFRSLETTLTGDVLEVSVEIAPVIPINFVRTTLHLSTTTLNV